MLLFWLTMKLTMTSPQVLPQDAHAPAIGYGGLKICVPGATRAFMAA